MIQETTSAEDSRLFEDEELAAQLQSIAESLASLSEIEEGPVGYELLVDPFQADDVDFTKNSWILQLAQVQAWLHLDASVARADIIDDPVGALVTFLKSIGQEDPGQCYKIEDGVVLLWLPTNLLL